MAGASTYGVVNVKVRAAKAELLSAADFVKLTSCYDVKAIALQLQETIYDKYLVGIDSQTITSQELVRKIRQRIPEKFSVIHDNLQNHDQTFIELIFSWYELINLKTVLRGINYSSSWENIQPLLIPLGRFESLPFEIMVASGSIEQAIYLLKNSKYYATLMAARNRFIKEESLFPIEVLLDLEYWQKVWLEIDDLPLVDQKTVRPIISRIIERNDLIWAARYRYFFHLKESEIINYTLGIGTKVKDDTIRQIAHGKNFGDLISEIYPNLAEKFPTTVGEGEQLSLWEVELTREIARSCRMAFLAQPFSLGPSLAYLLLLEYEIQDLVLLIEAKAIDVTRTSYQPYLINQGQN
jgi:V/A-type H+-transporting ATPase subunit C